MKRIDSGRPGAGRRGEDRLVPCDSGAAGSPMPHPASRSGGARGEAAKRFGPRGGKTGPWVAAALWIVACAPSGSEPPSDSAPGGSGRWATVVRGSDLSVLEGPARLVGTATAAATVSVLVQGAIHQIYVRPGDRVEKGTPLVEIASPDLADLSSQWNTAQRTVRLEQERIDRLEALAGENLASQQRLTEGRIDLAETIGRRDRSWSQLAAHGLSRRDVRRLHRTGRYLLRSPIFGVVTGVHGHLGQTVGPNSGALVRVQGSGRLRVEARVDRPTDGLRLDFVSSDGRRFAVRTPAVAELADPETGQSRLWFDLAGLPEFASALVGVLEGRAPSAWEVPAAALFEQDGQTVVYRKAEVGADPLMVRVFDRNASVAVVEGELRAGDQVSTDPTLWAGDR